jgi:ADP-ribose pyrophosphatase
MVEKWEKLTSKPLADYRIFRLRQDTSRSPRTGQSHTFFVLDSPDWINVIPLTPEGKVVFVHQFRHGIEEVTLEIPGGLVDPEDHSPEETVRRELLEETGYEADEVIHIGTVTANPAFLNNKLYTYLALGARQTQRPQLDGSEDIAVEEIDISAVPGLISSGHITHSLVVVAFSHYDRYMANEPGKK